MASVDNRIVSMEMRNEQFEQNAKQSMKTIEALDTSLKTLSTAKGLDDIKTGNVTDSLSSITNGVNAIVSSFTLLGNIGIKVLNDIATTAYNAGKSLLNSFTVEPIFTGFQEYETQINAIQTILSNTRKDGTTLEQVNGALNELNHYADMTIYNFTEMTRNIGTFTAAGVDLDTSVAAIKGIANLAAISGSNSAQASRAMYQLSQAIAAGTVNLQDWNSVVNAGMGGQVFQDALKETAHLMGLVTEAEPGQSFRESIATRGGTGWLTSEVLLETLKKFTGDLTEAELLAKGYTEQQAKDIIALGDDANKAATKVKTLTQLLDTLKEAAQSGWTQSWQFIIGDFEEARDALTAVSDTFGAIIGASADARNKVLADWKTLGGRDELFAGLKNIFEVIMSYATIIKTSFEKVFPPTTGAQLVNITRKFKEFTSGLKLNVTQTKQLRETFQGLFSFFNIIGKTLSSTFRIFSPIIGEFSGFGDAILKVTSALGRYITKLDQTLFSSENFNEVVKGGQTVVSEFIKIIKSGVGKLSPLGDFFKSMFETVKNSDFGKSVQNFFAQLTSGEKFTIDPAAITSAFDKVKAKVKEFTSSVDLSELSKKVSEKFQEMGFTMENFKSAMSDVLQFFKDLKSKISETLGTFGDKLSGTKKSVEETKSIFTAGDIRSAISTGFLGVLVFSIKKLFGSLTKTFDGSHQILDNIATVIQNLGGVLKAYSNELNANALLKIAGAIAVLAGALIAMSFVPFEQLANVTVLLTLVGAALLGFFKVFAKIKASLGDGKKKDSGLNLKGIIGDIVEPFTGVIKAFQTKIKMEAISTIATTLLKFVAAIGVLAMIPADRLKDSVIAMGVAAGELSVAVAIMSLAAKNTKGTSFAGMALTLLGLGVAIKTMSKAMDSIKDLNAEQLTKSMTVLGTLMLLMAMFVKSLDSVKASLGSVASIITVTAAVAALTAVMAAAGQMEWLTISKGLSSIAGVLSALALAVNLMQGTLSGAASMIVVAGALAILIPELAILGNMEPKTIAIGLLALAGAFTVIGGAAYLIQPLAPALMMFSAALAGIVTPVGLVILAIAKLIASFENFANGLVTISNMSNEQIQALITNLTTMINGFLTLLPQMETAVAAIMTAIIKAIVQALVLAANDVATGLVVLLASVLELLARYAQPITESVLLILIGVLTALRDHAGDFVIVLMETLDQIILGLGEAFGPFLDSCIKFLVDVINGLADAIINNAGPLADAIIKLVDSLIYVLIEAIKVGVHALFGPAEMIADALLGGLRDGLDSHSPSKETESIGGDAMDGLGIGIDEDDTPITASKNKIEEMLDAMGGEASMFAGVGREQAQEYGKGFEEAFSLDSFLNKGTDDILASLDTQKASYGTSGMTLGTEFGDKLAEGVGAQAPTVAKAGNEVTSALTDSGLDVLDKAEVDYEKAGENIIARMTDGMSRGEDKVIRVLGDIMRSAVNKASDYYDDFVRIGEEVPEGLAKGIKSNSYPAIAAAAAVASNALKAAKEELDVNSPSKAFEYIGRMSDEGLANGLIKFSAQVDDAARSVGNSGLDAMQASLQEISNMAFDDISEDPVITPVLDLSNIQAGASQIDSLMGQNRTLAFNGMNMSNVLGNLSSISGYMAPKAITPVPVQTQNNDSKLTETLNKLETRITQLGDAITHIQVVMDTGALVGEIAGPMDRALGWKTTLRNRGV